MVVGPANAYILPHVVTTRRSGYLALSQGVSVMGSLGPIHWIIVAVVVLLLFGGAWLLAPKPAQAQPEKTDTPTRQEEKNVLEDSQSVLQVYDGEKTVKMTMAEYLPGVVRGEMPATFEEEALKVVYEQSFRYPDHADVQRMLGWTMLHCQRSEQAIQALQPLMSSKDKTPNDMLYMAYSLWAQNKRGEAIPLLMDYATVTAHKDNMSPRQKLEETLNMSASMLAKYRIDAVERQLIIDETVRRLTPTSPEGTDYTII